MAGRRSPEVGILMVLDYFVNEPVSLALHISDQGIFCNPAVVKHNCYCVGILAVILLLFVSKQTKSMFTLVYDD